jgi:hypothetical protein
MYCGFDFLVFFNFSHFTVSEKYGIFPNKSSFFNIQTLTKTLIGDKENGKLPVKLVKITWDLLVFLT